MLRPPTCDAPRRSYTLSVPKIPLYLHIVFVATVAFVLATLLTSNVSYVRAASAGPRDSSAIANLPSSWDDIHLAAISGTFKPVDGVDATPLVDFVMWGDHPADYFPSVANHARYCKLGQSNSTDSSELKWFKDYHPDWLTYTSDRKTLAYYHVGNYTDYKHTPLDFTNPDVQDYIVNQCLTPALAQGFTAVGFDHGTTLNYFAVAGHYDTSGNWVQLYSGATVDDAYRTATIHAFDQLTSKMRAAAKKQGKTIYIALNDYPNFGHNSFYGDLLPYTDVIYDESGFTNQGSSKNPYILAAPVPHTDVTNAWLTKVNDLLYAENTLGKVLILNGLQPYTIDATHLPHPADVQWVMANYLLVKSKHTYNSFVGTANSSSSGLNVSIPQYFTTVGHPTSSMYQSQNVYMRDYSSGMALVNPSPDQSYQVTLPTGIYVDMYGNTINTVTMPAHSGLVLVKIV